MSDLRRIMLVEDDPDIAILMRIALEDFAGLEFFHFPDGESALAAIADVRPELIVLDFRMPGMNGGDVLRVLRERADTRDIPIIFMTASLMPGHVSRLRELGALAVLPKPFDPLTIGDEIVAIWEKNKNEKQ